MPQAILGIASIALYFLVGLICFVMAARTLFAKRFLPFHEAAARVKWELLESGVQDTTLTLIHLSGMGFLVVALLLAFAPIVGYFHPDLFITIAVPALAMVFCFGLFCFNYQLYKKTNASTPWRSSLIAMGVIIVSFVLSLPGRLNIS